MRRSIIIFLFGLAWFGLAGLHAGQFKRVTIDGDFDDWLGVPVSEVDEVDGEGVFDLKDVAIANDDDYLYVRVRLHAPSSYSGFYHQLLVDTDADGGTGYGWGGLGSELLVENGSSYQQKNGGFNEGSGSDLGWKVSPSGSSTQFEMRLSRTALDAEGLAVFEGDDVAVSVLAQTLEWQLSDSVENQPYTFATQPAVFQGSKSLTNLQDTFWFYQEVSDPEPDWLLPDYLGDDTWQGGKGFFSYGFDADVYPLNDSVRLARDRTTYYFRVPFLWESAAVGVALLAEAHLSDGAVFYLNGDEVRRVRMPAGEIDGSTQALASSASPGDVETFSLPTTALINGENLLMVEVHQAPDSLASLAFGLTLMASDGVPPRFEQLDQPADRDVVEGQSTVFELGTLAGTEPYTFQWYKDAAPIEGALGRRLEIPVVLLEHAGTYSVEVSNASGSVRSREALLTTSADAVSFFNDTQPMDQTIVQGESFVLSVEVAGSPILSYQWYKGDVSLDLATNAYYDIDAASAEDAGEYHVVVSNRVNSLSSRKATIVVLTDDNAPSIDHVRAGSGSVEIRFSEQLSASSASDPIHYSIPGIVVNDAVLMDDLQTVTLTTDALAFREDYALTVEGVEDCFGNAERVVKSFRATILIDGDFTDWSGIEPMRTDDIESEGLEFHQFWVVNDADYLYLRFSFHESVGQLPVDHYYQIFIDGDNDPDTGLSVGTIGSSLMIENGNGWLQTGGSFNEGSVADIDFQLAGAMKEFECRIALASSKDGLALFTAGNLGLTLNLVSTGWAIVDSGPTEAIVHTLTDVPALTEPEVPGETSLPLVTIQQMEGKVEISWEEGMLESSETLLPNSWARVPGVSSPLVIEPDNGTRFYRSNH